MARKTPTFGSASLEPALVPALEPALVDARHGDLNQAKFKFLHPKHIPLIQRPLVEKPKSQDGEQALESPLSKDGTTTVQSMEVPQPQLKFETATSTNQLFYDLFFVANLTTFTGKHDVVDTSTLKSYIGYFSLLWFTWFQVALFDVRFGSDSAFERLCKAIQFGIMVGLAVEGPNYDLVNFEPNVFKILSLILMASRLVLAVQYVAAWWWLRKSKAHGPLLIHMATMIVSSLVLLALALAFTLSGPGSVRFIDGWYVLFGVEAAVILFVSGNNDLLDFRKTVIIERLGLLTLIILGEGIMGLGEAVGKLIEGDGVFSSDVIGLITSAVLIVYFLYMLYFDQIESKGEKEEKEEKEEEDERRGIKSRSKKVDSLCQQIWSLGHFPLHVCILLIVEGTSQLIIWRRIIDYLNVGIDELDAIDFPATNTTSDWVDYAAAVNATLTNGSIFNFTDTGTDFTDPLTAIAESGGNLTTIAIGLNDILAIAVETISRTFQVEVPEGLADSGLDYFTQIVQIFSTVFLYFLISAGLNLILLACLFLLGNKTKTRPEYMSIAIRLFVGIGLALLTTMYAPVASGSDNTDAFYKYLASPWITPTVVIAYALVVALDIVLIVFTRTVVRRRGEV